MTSEFTVAVHSLVYLYHHDGQVYSSEALAGNVCTNPARIRKVMAKLKKCGFVETKEGKEGGYCAERDSAKITLCAVAEALSVRFVAVAWKSGNPEMSCLIASGMRDAMDEVCEELNELCYERLGQITIEDIDKKLVNSRGER